MVIDHLEPGGAQRQFCLLATSLRRLGFSVKIFVFRPDSFFKDSLQGFGAIPVAYLKSHSRLHLILLVRTAVRQEKPDVVVSFLSWPNLLVELSGVPRRQFGIIVSERNLDMSRWTFKRYLRYFFHRFADSVVSNSYAQRERIEHIASHLVPRASVIVNGVDTQHFRPSGREREHEPSKTRMLVVARFAPQKNVIRLVEAVQVVRSRYPKIHLVVDWYGKKPVIEEPEDVAWGKKPRRHAAAYYRQVEEIIARHMLQDRFRLHAPHKDVRELYWSTDVVCLPSLYEGCSNVIGEAMACGVPILASRVSDNVRLVEDGRNGFLFDPLSVEDIAETIVGFGVLSPLERRRQGREGRNMAVSTLCSEVFIGGYVKLIEKITSRRSRA